MKRNTNKSIKIFSIFLLLGLLFILFAPINHNHSEGVRCENDTCEICEMIKVNNEEFKKVVSVSETEVVHKEASIDYVIEDDVFFSLHRDINTLESLKTCLLN